MIKAVNDERILAINVQRYGYTKTEARLLHAVITGINDKKSQHAIWVSSDSGKTRVLSSPGAQAAKYQCRSPHRQAPSLGGRPKGPKVKCCAMA